MSEVEFSEKINELVKRIAENSDDNEAIKELSNLMFMDLRFLVIYFLKNSNYYEDVIQTTLIKVWKNAKNLTHFTQCQSWIIKILKHTAMKLNKKLEKEKVVDFTDAVITMQFKYFIDNRIQMDKNLEFEEIFNSLKKDEQELVLMLRAGMKRRMIMQAKNWTPAKIRYRMKRLRDAFGRYYRRSES